MLVLLAAVDEGLGAAFVGAFDDDEVRALLGLPRGVRPIGIIPIGFCAERPRKLPLIPKEQIIHYERWRDDRGYVMRDREGKPVRMIGAMVDITERRDAEDALRESQRQLQSILDYSPLLMFVKDTNGRYLLWNPPFDRFCGRAREQIVGRTDWEIFRTEQAALFASNDRKVLEAGVPIDFEEVAFHPDGPRTSIVSKFPLRDAQGRIYAVGGVVADISDRRRAEDELMALKDKLAAELPI